MASRDLNVVWGVNRWVLVETANGSVERQVATKDEFAALLTQIGFAPDAAGVTAAEQWKRRPRDADATAARPGDGLRRATGLSQGKIAMLFGVFILLFVLWIAVIRPHVH